MDDILIHAITDGRESSPTGGSDYLATVAAQTGRMGAHIATVIGRYYAMDRDERWDRNKIAWDAIVLGRGPQSNLASAAAIPRLILTSVEATSFCSRSFSPMRMNSAYATAT